MFETLHTEITLKFCEIHYFLKINRIFVFMHSPMTESFVAVYDILLKFHNLPAKFACIILMNK